MTTERPQWEDPFSPEGKREATSKEVKKRVMEMPLQVFID